MASGEGPPTRLKKEMDGENASYKVGVGMASGDVPSHLIEDGRRKPRASRG
jgi:hypothetical protein